jgi:Ca2+-binding EF-hand superfamily protein
MNHYYRLGTAIAAGVALATAAGAAPGNPATAAAAPQVETKAQILSNTSQMFAKFDANKDGFVTQAEINAKSAAREQKVASALEKRAAAFDPNKMIAHFDTNKDGKVTRAEADAVVAAQMKAKGKNAAGADKRVGQLFARADTNKDGVLTAAEVGALRPDNAQIEKFAEAQAKRGGPMEAIMTAADANKDGKLSLAEMQAFASQRFDRIDTNHDGKVTPQERQALRQKVAAKK